jgi:uncharacterized protein YndB with AHSA1/START domain
MKILKKILMVLLLLIVAALVVAIFTKKDYTIEREVVINKPKQQVFDYVKMLKNQNYYSKWNMKDPNAKMEYKGTDGTVGFVSSWDSKDKEVGTGEQEIAKITDGQRIDMNLHFIKPFEGRSTAYMTTEAVGDNQTKVKWGFNGHMPYPMNLMLLCMNMEKMIGDDLSTNLTNLKGVLEKQ